MEHALACVRIGFRDDCGCYSAKHLCSRLDIEVVAEGVETLGQFEALREMDCGCLQGYLIGRPMSEKDIPTFLRKFELDTAVHML